MDNEKNIVKSDVAPLDMTFSIATSEFTINYSSPEYEVKSVKSF